MGCKQTTIKSPSIISIPSSVPVYAKSALKKSRSNKKGKTEKLSFLRRKSPILNKSVNFDEKVQVKLRTPTPRQTQYENRSSTNTVKRQVFVVDDDDDQNDDDDDQVSSISSQDEDINNEQIKTSTTPPTSSLQRSQSNSFWHKSNSIGVIPSTNNIKEKTQQLPVNMIKYPTENSNMPIGNRFLVRRKAPYPVIPQISNSVDPNQTSSTPSFPSPVQSSSLSVQPSPNTNPVLIEHRASFINDRSSPQTAYYAFIRRPVDNTISTEK